MVVVMINLFSNRGNVRNGEGAVLSAQDGCDLAKDAKLGVRDFGYYPFSECMLPGGKSEGTCGPSFGFLADFLS
jgi:hypothetical protein